MKKNHVYKKNGIKVVENIQNKRKKDRVLFPRPVVFRDKTKYNRKRLPRITDS